MNCTRLLFIARCTIAHVVCLTVCPSVRDVAMVDQDHKSWKLIARTLSLTPSLFVAQRPSTYSQGTWGNFGETRSGVGKSGVLYSTKAAISLKRVQIEEKLLWGAYRNSPALFPTAPAPTPYGLSSFRNIGVRTPPKTPIAITGCLQLLELLEILEISWNLLDLLEILV